MIKSLSNLTILATKSLTWDLVRGFRLALAGDEPVEEVHIPLLSKPYGDTCGNTVIDRARFL